MKYQKLGNQFGGENLNITSHFHPERLLLLCCGGVDYGRIIIQLEKENIM